MELRVKFLELLIENAARDDTQYILIPREYYEFYKQLFERED